MDLYANSYEDVDESKWVSGFERYTLGAQIASTNTSELYFAEDVIMDSSVVLKRTLRSCLKNIMLEDSEREVELMKLLWKFDMGDMECHPNILSLIDYFETEKHRWIVLERCNGGDLWDYVKQNGRIDEATCKDWIRQVINAVEFLHEKSIVHLDVSLENVLLNKEEEFIQLKLCDFGMARIGDEKDGFQFTGMGRGPGKLGYMAPEVYRGKNFNGKLADAYSVGIVLFIMLFGFPPYERPVDSDKRFHYLMKGDWELLFRKWKLQNIPSDEAIDFLKRLICEEKKRENLHDLLSHKWLMH